MNKKKLCILLSMAMLSHQVAYASDQSPSGDAGPSGQWDVVIAMPAQEKEGMYTDEEAVDANVEGNGVSCSDVTVWEATPSEAVHMKDTKTGEGDSEGGELNEVQGSYAIPNSLLRAAYGAEYYQGDWDPDANQNAVRIPKVYPAQSANYLPSLPAAAVTSSLYKTYGPNGCADVQIQVGSGSNGSLNRIEVTVNLKTGQLLILRPMGASKHSYFHLSYINDNKGRRFSDFAKLYHPSDSYYSRYKYAWLMRVTCDMAGNWDAHADGWNTVNNEGDRVYYGPAHWTMHLNVAHDYGPWTTASEPSCTVQGTQRRTCRDCGSVQTQSTSVLGHAFSDGYYMGANDGTYFKRCTRPGCDARTDVKYNPYTVVFDANGGSGNMNSQPSVYQTPVVLPVNQYTRDYHTFQGWNSQPDGGGTAYGDGQSVLNLTKIYGAAVTLYAQWLPNTYIITFADGMDGGQNVQKGLLYTGKLGTLPEFIRKGYTLLGFYTEPAGGTRITEETDVPHEDTTYHAHWSANKYRITFHTRDAHCDIEGKAVIYDKTIGILPVPVLEDYAFLGWYAQPYGEEKEEGIMYGEALPEPGQKIASAYEYTVDRDMDAYAYFTLVFRDLGDGTNRRPGKDGAIGTEDDNLYLNGTDGVAGTRDDRKIYEGEDGQYGTEDDFYLDDEGRKHFPGPDRTFGTEDDYRDDGNGWNTRPGPDCIFETQDDITVSNGWDRIPGTADDWMDNGETYPSTSRRPGNDGIFGTEDDEIWSNGPDGAPGTEDDVRIYPGLDGIYGTGDDWYDNQDFYSSTNVRPGPDGEFWTEDDEIWFNGPDSIPGNEDDLLLIPGPDGIYGTEDDCYDNRKEQEGTNIRPGKDGIFGTEDDELWLNGPDRIPGTEDDEKYVPRRPGGGTGGSHATGKRAYRPYHPLQDVAILTILEAPIMEIPAEISGLPVLLEQKTEDDVRQTQVQPECDMPAVSIPDVTNWEVESVKTEKASASEVEKEKGDKEAAQGKAILTAILLLVIIMLVIFLIRRLSSHAQKQE